MAKDYLDFSESKAWNVAADYTRLKIMKLLYLADEYELIATFGTSDLIDEFMINQDSNTKSLARIMGINRLTKTLLMLISNTVFAIKKEDKVKIKKYKERLEKIKKVLPAIKTETINQRYNTRTIIIKEEVFQKLLGILTEIKGDLNEPLNKADLIFSSSEEFDPDELKARIKEDMLASG